MKLGVASVQFLWLGMMERFDSAGRPLPLTGGAIPDVVIDQYFVHKGVDIDRDDPFCWLIEHCHEFGLDALELPAQRPGGTGNSTTVVDCMGKLVELARLRELSEQHDVMLTWGFDDNFSSPQKPIEDLRWHLRAAKELGVDVFGIGTMPFSINRWVSDPPFARQMQMIVDCVTPWVAEAEDAGVKLALENHADYRCHELMEHVIDPIDSPNLGIKLDTGNCMLVLEDPVDAARVVAHKCFDTHLKDVYVHPFTVRGGMLVGAPIGRGHGGLDVVLQILAEQAPEPERLALSMELMEPVPTGEYFVWLEDSVKWCRRTLAGLSDAPVARSAT